MIFDHQRRVLIAGLELDIDRMAGSVLCALEMILENASSRRNLSHFPTIPRLSVRRSSQAALDASSERRSTHISGLHRLDRTGPNPT